MEISLAPLEVKIVNWAIGGAHDYWDTEDFTQGRKGIKPLVKDNTLVIPDSELSNDYIDDLVDRMEQYQDMARDQMSWEAGTGKPGPENTKLMAQIRSSKSITKKLESTKTAPSTVTPEVTRLTGDIWNRMTPAEREQLGVKAKLDAATRGGRWMDLFPEEKRALIREFKKEQLAIPTAEAGTHPLILKQYPIGEVPEKIEADLEIPIPEPRVVRKPKDIPDNAAIRTQDKFDRIVQHLGYEPISLEPEMELQVKGLIPTDVDIINDSQRRLRSAEVVPDEKLDSRQLSHLKLARVVAKDIFHTPVSVYAAVIPPASDRVRTAGLYGTTTGVIYINLDQLYSGRTTVDTLVHELGHHREYRQTGSAEDLSPAHAEAMTDVAARVVKDVAKGTFDKLLKEVSW